MWQGLMIAVLQSAAPAGLVVDGAVLTEDVIESFAGDIALRLDVTVSNLTDETQCIQRSNLDTARWTVRDIETGEMLEPGADERASQSDQGSILQIRPGDTKAFGVELFAIYQFEENHHYDVMGSLLTTPCELDEAGHPQWSLNASEARYLSVSYSPAPESARIISELDFVGSRFDGEELIVTVRNEGEAAVCVSYEAVNPGFVHEISAETGQRISSPRDTLHVSRNSLHRITPLEEFEIRFQLQYVFDLESMPEAVFGGEFEYAACSQYQLDVFGFARPVDGQASVLTYTYDPTTD
jgi:hypothetical protein